MDEASIGVRPSLSSNATMWAMPNGLCVKTVFSLRHQPQRLVGASELGTEEEEQRPAALLLRVLWLAFVKRVKPGMLRRSLEASAAAPRIYLSPLE
jgi:hypothetical protein